MQELGPRPGEPSRNGSRIRVEHRLAVEVALA